MSYPTPQDSPAPAILSMPHTPGSAAKPTTDLQLHVCVAGLEKVWDRIIVWVGLKQLGWSAVVFRVSERGKVVDSLKPRLAGRQVGLHGYAQWHGYR